MLRSSCFFTTMWLVACAPAHESGPEPAPEDALPATPAAASGDAPRERAPAPDATIVPVTRSATAERGARDDVAPQLWPLREHLSRSTKGLALEPGPDGVLRLPLQGRFGSAVLIHRNASGQRERVCVDSLEAAERVLGAKP